MTPYQKLRKTLGLPHSNVYMEWMEGRAPWEKPFTPAEQAQIRRELLKEPKP